MERWCVTFSTDSAFKEGKVWKVQTKAIILLVHKKYNHKENTEYIFYYGNSLLNVSVKSYGATKQNQRRQLTNLNKFKDPQNMTHFFNHTTRLQQIMWTSKILPTRVPGPVVSILAS